MVFRRGGKRIGGKVKGGEEERELKGGNEGKEWREKMEGGERGREGKEGGREEKEERERGRKRREEREREREREGNSDGREVGGEPVPSTLYYQYLVRKDPADHHNDQHYQKVPEDGKF